MALRFKVTGLEFSYKHVKENAYYMGLDVRKPVFGGFRTTKAQTSLHIRTV